MAANTGRRLYLRVNTKNSYVDILTEPDDWYLSDEADVAVACWSGPAECTITSVPLDQFVDEDYRYRGASDLPQREKLVARGGQLVRVGHEVFFVGLFSQHAGRTRNLPIVRFGYVSRPPLEPVTVRLSDDPDDQSVTEVNGYLVEARSWGGHSGSPAFWYYPGVRVDFAPDPRAQVLNHDERRRRGLTKHSEIPLSREMGVYALLGLVTAHFGIQQEARTEGDIFGRVVTDINAGIAVVTPAHYIRRLIERDDVVEDGEKFRAHPLPEPAATFDIAKEDDSFAVGI